jgi:hypothetical protein
MNYLKKCVPKKENIRALELEALDAWQELTALFQAVYCRFR